MVQLDTANQSHIPGPRRHTESPALWISVIAGSMLLHTLLFLGLRIYLARTTKIQPAAEPIAVEFVEPSANTTAVAPAVPSSAAAPNTTPPDAPPAAEPDLPFPPEASATSVPAPSATAPDTIAQAPPETPASVPSARDAPESPPSPVPNAPSPSINPDPDRPDPPNPTPSLPPPNGSTGAPVNQPGESPSGGGSLPAPPPNLSPGGSPTDSGSNDSGDSTPPVVPISPERGQGSGVQLTVTGLSQVDAGRDVVDTLPQQSLPTLSLPEQIYPPGVGLNFGTPVTIRVLLDQQGKPKRIINIQQGSASADYDQLAKELLLQAQFPPVLQSQRQGQGVEQTVDITLTLNPVQQ